MGFPPPLRFKRLTSLIAGRSIRPQKFPFGWKGMGLLFLIAILAPVSSKVMRASTKTFKATISKSPLTLVLFASVKSAPCRILATSMDSLSIRFSDSIGMIVVNSEANPELVEAYKVPPLPTIIVFRNSEPQLRYFGEWSTSGLAAFCASITDQRVVLLSDSFSVFEFQHRTPANLIITSPELQANAGDLLDRFRGLIHVGIVTDPILSEALGLPAAVISRPDDFYSMNLSSVEPATVERHIHSRYDRIHVDELLGATPTTETIVALVDERDRWMLRQVMQSFDSLSHIYRRNVSFQICDFLKCPRAVEEAILVQFFSPLYIHHSKHGNLTRSVAFRRINATASEFVNWAKFSISTRQREIPRLRAHEFVAKVLDPKCDVVLFVTTPQMPGYDRVREMVKKLMKVFEKVPKVTFYEFNPDTEYLTGLKLQRSNEPQLSIWPATSSPKGSQFVVGEADMDRVYEALFELFTTKFGDKLLAELADRLQRVKVMDFGL
jgi:hypothetical protein